MRIGTFAASTAALVTQFDSNFHLAPLTERAPASVRIQVAYLAAGGRVGRHRAVAAQMFCVVAGDGWVSGADDAPLSVHAGQVAVWDAGEFHAAGTDSGLTAVVVEGEFVPACEFG
jgi:quercetin dioxygenase-like cupin family protein